ncbi:hypothetical protein E5288_WYG006875 [Bos mutus]|uniref:Uncharacterized protein n=1 Tax=Bos mutus TaxID=72004 RepID=A0A6B0QWY3_9CETA|nr:hypothetical protein [Bos mutus]
MDPAPSLGCSLKDVKWSSVAVPLDLLVSTYRLPQIARLDSAVGGLRFVFLKKILIHLKVSATLNSPDTPFRRLACEDVVCAKLQHRTRGCSVSFTENTA